MKLQLFCNKCREKNNRFQTRAHNLRVAIHKRDKKGMYKHGNVLTKRAMACSQSSILLFFFFFHHKFVKENFVVALKKHIKRNNINFSKKLQNPTKRSKFVLTNHFHSRHFTNNRTNLRILSNIAYKTLEYN